jgi:hypothetical protein
VLLLLLLLLPSASEPFTQGDTGSRKTNGTVNERRFLPLSDWQQDISGERRAEMAVTTVAVCVSM